MNGQQDGAAVPIRIEDGTSYNPTKGTHRVRNVHYRLPDGTQSYVTIPHDEYTAERVQAELANAAQTHSEVMSVRAFPGQIPLTPTESSRYG
jgi:hypothetical protein